MEAALCIEPVTLPRAAERSSIWAGKIARMTRRLETRWSDSPVARTDTALDDLRCAHSIAHVEFAAAMLELAGDSRE